MYGNYNFWSWYRYWHVDTINQISLLTLDRPYFDYDYEVVKGSIREIKPKTDEEMSNVLKRFGINMRPSGSEEKSAEQLQQEVMASLQNKK